jgi:hypothetical protein
MKYFAKYLLVGGEIKSGDMVLKPAFRWYAMNGDPIDEPPYLEIAGEDEVEDFPKFKLAKLFLCSRDIQVGDEIRNPQLQLDAEWTVVPTTKDIKDLMEVCLQEALKHNCFKVIGEISPEATFVKEGEEFDEGDFKLATDIIRPKKGANGEYLPPWAWMRCKCCGEFK